MAEVILSAQVPVYVHVEVDPARDYDTADIRKVVVGDEELPSDASEFAVVDIEGAGDPDELAERARAAVENADIMWPGWRFGY